MTIEMDVEPSVSPAGPVVDEQLVAGLVARAGAEGLSVTGEGGLLAQLTKLVLEASLEGELDAHLGYGKHDPAGRDGGNGSVALSDPQGRRPQVFLARSTTSSGATPRIGTKAIHWRAAEAGRGSPLYVGQDA